jgi:hypothetical protein
MNRRRNDAGVKDLPSASSTQIAELSGPPVAFTIAHPLGTGVMVRFPVVAAAAQSQTLGALLPMRWKLVIAVLSMIAVGALSIAVASNPLRKSDVELRAWLLAKTPLGSSMADVRSLLDRHGWHDARFQQRRPLPATEPFLGGDIGSYQGLPWHTSVRAFWEFDSSNRLVNIRIERILDSP